MLNQFVYHASAAIAIDNGIYKNHNALANNNSTCQSLSSKITINATFLLNVRCLQENV
jgi:hypothetical protein